MLGKLAYNIYYNLTLISLVPTLFVVILFFGLKRSVSKPRIRLIGELVSIGIIAFCFFLLLFFLVNKSFQDLYEISDHVREIMPDEKKYRRFLVPGISFLSWTVLFVSCAQFFNIKITKLKRIVLFVLCSMPIILAAFTIVIEPKLDNRLVIRLGIISSLPCWLINSSALLIGKTLIEVLIVFLYRCHLLP
jgi:hypothetical protein